MSAFGLNSTWSRNFAYGIKSAGGGTLSAKILEAIDSLIRDLHVWSAAGAGLSGSFRFLYPFVGGNATAHSFNLLSPTTCRITWSGTVTHDGNGITGSTTGRGNTGTGLTGASGIQNTIVACGVYSRTDGGIDSYEISNTSGYSLTSIICKWSDGKAWFYDGGVAPSTQAYIDVAVSDARGLFSVVRTTPSLLRGYQNGAQIGADQTTLVNSYATTNFLIGGLDATTSPSTRNLAFAFLTMPSLPAMIGNQAGLYTVIQNFQTRLGRQV